MDSRYVDDYNGSYKPRGPPSYVDSQVNGSYHDGSVPRAPPSYTGSVPHSYRDQKEFEDNRSSNHSNDMSRYPRDNNRGDYTRDNNRGDYTAYSDRDSRRSDVEWQGAPRDRYHPDQDIPRDKYYPDQDIPRDRYHPDQDIPEHGSYDSRSRQEQYQDDRRGYREGGRDPYNSYVDRDRGYYEDRSDSYKLDPGYSDRGYPDERDSYKQEGRYEARGPYRPGGRDREEYEGVRHPDREPPAEVDDVRLNERHDNGRYNAEREHVDLTYAPPVTKQKKKPVLKELKPKVIKEKWKQKPVSERRKYCVLFTCLVLTVVCIIVVPLAIYVRLWHKLTWDDIRNLQVEPRNIKWGQHGNYVYYKDIINNVYRVDLTHSEDSRQAIIFEFETWNKVGYDDFDVTGPGTMLVLAKKNGEYLDLYKYLIGDSQIEPQKFQMHVVHWEIVPHLQHHRIVFVQQDPTTKAYNIRLQEMGPNLQTLKDIDTPTDNPTFYRGLLSYVYAEQFFGGSTKGFWVSPDGERIVYMETDTSLVNTVNVQSPADPSKTLPIYYPTAGGTNPIVKLKLYDVILDKIIDGANEALDPGGKQDSDWVTSVSFPNTKKLLVEFMNREQTRARTELCTMTNSPTCAQLAVLNRHSFLGWLPRYPGVAFPAEEDPDTQQFYVLRPRVDRQFNFTHLHKYEQSTDPNKKIAVTNGEFAVTELIGTDHTRQHVLYVRTEVLSLDQEDTASTRTRKLYMYNATSNRHTCISCLEPSNRCNVATARIERNLRWYQLVCLGPQVPYLRIKSFSSHHWNVYSDQNQNIQYENPSTQAQLLQKKSPWTQYTQTELDKNSRMYVAVKKIFPLYYVKYVNILKYPLVIWVNPYPDGNMATERYKLDLAQWLATDKSCVVIYMDVAGTPGRGLSFHHWPYKNFKRIVDKAEQAIKDIKMYWHVNDNSVAIMGEGLGGWLALKIMQRKPEWFKASIAVNPILDFNKLLSAYSERYLGEYRVATSSIYTEANMDFGNFTTEMKTKTAIYYDPSNTQVPGTYQTIRTYLENNLQNNNAQKPEYVDFEHFNLYNLWEMSRENGATSENPFINVGLNITHYLEEAPHNIF